MKYNFNEIIDRKNTQSVKWSRRLLEEKFKNDKAIPMWIADMDFMTAPPIIEAMAERVQHGIFGYTETTPEFFLSCVKWQEKRNQWKIKPEWIIFAPGVVPALNKIVKALCKKGEGVIVQDPVYYPFFSAIKKNECIIKHNTLLEKNGKYEMDFDGLEKLAKDVNTKLMIVCNPQNPVGRVWTESDLRKLGEICFKNNVTVVVDEIHADLVYSPNKHISFGGLGEEFLQNSIICTAPSKSFNMAGLQVSDIIVANEELRKKVKPYFEEVPNPFAVIAQIAAYEKGEEWLEEMKLYVKKNLEFTYEFIKENMPKVRMSLPEATYLAWLDFRDYNLSDEEIDEILIKKCNLALDRGIIFGQTGSCFARMNMACPKSVIEEALKRLKEGFQGV